MEKIILASQSPRRRELLTAMGVDFDIIPSSYDEVMDPAKTPEDLACDLALGKALDISHAHITQYIIGADTIVMLDGKVYGKPADAAEAHEMLRELSGKTHQVITGVAVVRLMDATEIVASCTTDVTFKPYDAKAIDDYIATGDPFDKAGGYGIQSDSCTLVQSIDGEYDNVVGLPTKLLAEILNSLGIHATSVTIVDKTK